MVLQPLELRFFHSIKDVFKTKDRIPKKIAIALSGGLDSMCLTHLLHKVNKVEGLGIEIHTISMDHGLRNDSHQEIDFIGRQVTKLGLYNTFHPQKLDLSNLKQNDSFEEIARVKRYETLHKICQKHLIENIMTGHHFDDNLETFVLRLIGNSGIMGLRGIQKRSVTPYLSPPFHSIHKINLLRPLLDITKAELYNYAQKNDIEWVEDHTNDLEVTKRNTVRSYLRQHPIKKSQLIEVHHRILEFTELIEVRVNELYRSMQQEGQFEFSAKGFKVKFDQEILDGNSDLVIASLLFKVLYPYSPAPNYHYCFHKLLKNIPKLRNIETFTLLQLKWNIRVGAAGNTEVFIRRQNSPNPVSENLIIPPLSETNWFLFDNIYWFKFKNPSNSRLYLLLKTVTIKDKFARQKVKGESLLQYEGTPFVYNLNDTNDSYFPLIEEKKNNPWMLKHNIYSFESSS